MPTRKQPKGNSLAHSSGARGPKPGGNIHNDGARAPKSRPTQPPKR